jgi:hypothetical protein
MMKASRGILVCTVLLAAGAVGACTSHIVPLRPLEQAEVWVPDNPTTSPSAAAATSMAPAVTDPAATEATTQPGHLVTRMVDPNQTTRFVYNASYDNVWKQASALLTTMGFEIDRQDYRLGAITTLVLPSTQIVEFWKPQQVNPLDSMENTLNNQRRWVRLAISAVEDKPNFYEIAVRVLVERETNPSEAIGGPIFAEGSGFGRDVHTLRSDYTPTNVEKGKWVTLGHDPDMEKKILDALFERI